MSHGEALDVGDSNASGDVQSGRRTKDQLIVEATEHLNEALRLNSRDICAIVAAGMARERLFRSPHFPHRMRREQ